MRDLPEIYGWLAGFFALALVALSGWMTLQGLACQDGLAFYTAGELYNEGAVAIYPTMEGLRPVDPPSFHEAYCGRFPEDQGPCGDYAVSFVSPPVALPWVSVMAYAPFGAAVLVMRSLGALCLVGAALWASATVVRQNPRMALPLGAALVVMLPCAMNPVENGQNSPWLVAVAALSLAASRRPSRGLEALAGALLAGCAVFKGSPGALALLWLYPLRPVAVGTFSVVLGLSALVAGLTVPAGFWTDYRAFAPGFARWIVDFSQNGSIDAALRALGLLPDQLVGVFPLVKALAMGLAFVGALRAGVGPSGRVALAWAAWLVVNPLVWFHYLWLLWAMVLAVLGPQARGPWAGALWLWLVAPAPLLAMTLQAWPSGQVLTALWIVAGAAALYGVAVARGPAFGEVSGPPRSPPSPSPPLQPSG